MVDYRRNNRIGGQVLSSLESFEGYVTIAEPANLFLQRPDGVASRCLIPKQSLHFGVN